MALAGKFARVLITDGASVAFTAETMGLSLTDNALFTILDGTKTMWDPTADVSVTVDGDPVDSSEYTVEYAGGRIRFREEPEPSVDVKASGKAFESTSVLGQAHGWEFNQTLDTEDVTVFGDETKKHLPLLRDGTVSLDRFAIDTFFTESLGGLLYLILHMNYEDDDSVPRIECVGTITNDNITASASGVIEETVEILLNGEPQFVEE